MATAAIASKNTPIPPKINNGFRLDFYSLKTVDTIFGDDFENDCPEISLLTSESEREYVLGGVKVAKRSEFTSAGAKESNCPVFFDNCSKVFSPSKEKTVAGVVITLFAVGWFGELTARA